MVGTGVEIVYVGGAGAVVKDEGKLGVIVGSVEQGGHLTGIQILPDLIDGLTGHGIDQCAFGQSREAGMIHLDAGIQDGDAHALTGVAGLVDNVCADHGGGIVGVLLKVLSLRQVEGRGNIHLCNMVHALQSCLIAVGSGNGEAGGGNGVGKAQLEAFLVAKLCLDAVLHSVQHIFLLLCMGLHGSGLGSDFTDGVKLQLGLLIDDDDKGDQIVVFRTVHNFLGEALPLRALKLGELRSFGSFFTGVFGGSLGCADGGVEFALFGDNRLSQVHNGKCVGNTAEHHGQHQNQG